MKFEDWQKIPRGHVAREVMVRYDINGERLSDAFGIRYVVKKGQGWDDWAIYAGSAEWDASDVLSKGNKVTLESTIRWIFPCDDQTFSKYRY